MTDLPKSLPAFEHRFPGEAACIVWLLKRRWEHGFAYPGSSEHTGKHVRLIAAKPAHWQIDNRVSS
jgi:hypothetical protein